MSAATDRSTKNVVVFCIDASYVLPCAFMIDQLAADPSGTSYDVVVLHHGLDDATAEALRVRVKRPVETIAYREQRIGALHDPQAGHVSRATYLRLYLDELLPPRYERILYLDTDMYIAGHEIAPLFEIDLGGAAVAGVEDVTLLMEMVRPELLSDIPRAWRGPEGVRRYRTGLGIDESAAYLNAGTMLVDRAAWRALAVGPRSLAFLEATPERCLFAEQSALNAALVGHWVELSARYNFQPMHGQAGLGGLFAPAILHFCGPQKPWNSKAWPAEISGAYQAWLRSSAWPGPFPALTKPLPWADYKAPKKRQRRSWLTRLRRRLTGRRPEGAASPGRGQRAFAAALLAGIGEPDFVDFDKGARQAFREAVAGAFGAPLEARRPTPGEFRRLPVGTANG